MNVFFLGAGFSRPAGLPLGDGLFVKILEEAKLRRLYEENLKFDINEYLDYYYAKTGKAIAEDQINLEEFMSYVDINNYLVLHGGHTSSAQGIIKNLIAYVLHNCENKITNEQLSLYSNFIERLDSHDIIFTFNYDTILEKVLNQKNIPYRLYETRHSYDEKRNKTIGDWKDKINIFKMHGSINWFDKSAYEETKKLREELEQENPVHAIFDGRMDNEIHRLLEAPFHLNPNHPFRNIYIVENLDKYFSESTFKWETPFIVPPSYHKLVNLNYLSDFWYRFSDIAMKIDRMAIIGFSLPSHDEYIRQPMYWFIKNFNKFDKLLSGEKPKLKIIDFQKEQNKIEEFKKNYRFVDHDRTDFYFGGFCEEALDIIFSEE